MLVGVLLLVVAPWVPGLIPNGVVWTDADAEQYTQASADLHAKSYQAAADKSSDHGHHHPGGTAEEKAAAQVAFDLAQSKRDGAVRRKNWSKYLLQAVGVLVSAVGIWGYVQNKRMSA